MVDKYEVCSFADPLVIDYIPDHTRETINKNIGTSEDIKALVKGMKSEALVVTDQGVHIAKRRDKCTFFSYDRILPGKTIFRVYRRGRFELPVEGKERARMPDEHREPDFGPDPADNVVNFPWSKIALFKKVDEIISINKKLYDSQAKEPAGTGEQKESDSVNELKDEIERLKKRVAELEGK